MDAQLLLRFCGNIKRTVELKEEIAAMLDFTAEQQNAIASGEPVPFTLNETECVVLRKDVFERMQHVAYDDSELTPEEMIAMAERAFNDADAAGPID
jgi:hypothetical protein